MPLPVIYSCSGCSSIAQLANTVAVELDRDGVAKMSCIAGVGGNVPSLVKIAKEAHNIIAIDGCQLLCVKACLEKNNIHANQHLVLSDLGFSRGQIFNRKEIDFVKSKVS